MGLLDLLPQIKSAVVGPIKTVLVSLRTALDTTIHIVDTLKDIAEESVGIYHEIQHFDIDPKWQNRALSVPDAIQNVKDLFEAPGRIFIAVKDLVGRIRQQLAPIQAAEAEATAAIEEASGVEGFLLRIFPKLARALSRALARLLAIVGLVVQGLIDISNTFADIRIIVGEFRVALESLNHLDAVFLRQNKKRKSFVLKDGSTIRRRIPIGHS